MAARRFPPDPSSVGTARWLVADLVEDPSLRKIAALLVSELATNALCHTGGGFDLTVRVGSRLRVEVGDESPEPPVLRTARPGSPGGRGLFLVHWLATDWGWERLETGKVVWFEL